MYKEVMHEVEQLMEKSFNFLVKEFGGVRTGRASVTLFEGIKVNYYNTRTPLNQVATISIPENRLVVLQPWDPTVIPEIERAIMKSDLGLTPSSDGKVIRLPVPELTEERRHELVKLVRKIAERERVTVRNERRDGNEKLKKLEKDSKISKDDYTRAHDEMQKLTDKYIKKIDDILKNKEDEIMKF
ncbi:MAG: ribosome recycling factor [Candidatus Schekmanbacteria bacterium]|nr:ribosome recycling factor [Candidatus Schekmanbacteria bacterium]